LIFYSLRRWRLRFDWQLIKMSPKFFITGCWIFLLTAMALAQVQPARPVPVQQAPRGVVYVSQQIDLLPQIAPGQDVFTPEGAPLPVLKSRNVTLGVVIDDEGHIVARLSEVTPTNPPQSVSVTTPSGKGMPAKFIGMDSVTGLCVLSVNPGLMRMPSLAESANISQAQPLTLYGFNPKQKQGGQIVMLRPRINPYACAIAKATDDFRYSTGTPLYYLKTPQLTPVQDGSVLFDSSESIFGVAFYDLSGEEKHLVYPISRIRNIAQAIIKSRGSIGHGWLGATGKDATPTVRTPQMENGEVPENVGPISATRGVMVMEVYPEGPADEAGIRKFDVLMSIGKYEITGANQLRRALQQLPADSEIALKIRRGNEFKIVLAKLALAPEDPVQDIVTRLEQMQSTIGRLPENDPQRETLIARRDTMSSIYLSIMNAARPEIRLRVLYGLEADALTPQLAEHFATPGRVLVTEVKPNSRFSLQAGDVIVKVGETEIPNIEALVRSLDDNASADAEITITREKKLLTLKAIR
jgi:S1-C subfamily serine protease